MKQLYCKEYKKNGKEISVFYVSQKYCKAHRIPVCDCIFLHYDNHKKFNGDVNGWFMRPDEALETAEMLIRAVNDVTCAYKIRLRREAK